jgi:peptidoglycan/xylan/chitin deacetylase (PgdA/CDA1 family)
MPLRSKIPYVSFTFDDFPRSALYNGGAILQRFGLTGTYYTSLGLMGKQTPTGEMFLREDLSCVQAQGHELGCHTFEHCDAWETNPSIFEQSVIKNRDSLNQFLPGASFRTLSYPISVPRPFTKQRIEKYFACCRCGGQTFNSGTADLNYLAAYFLEKTRENPAAIKDVIQRNRNARGWLILATHDVAEDPTSYGCTPKQFEQVVLFALDSGARILPVVKVWEELSSHQNTSGEAEA